ncbi:pPIWI-associating nuclease domain-containing protein [Bradyrhizobium sp. UFLA05-112]
MPNDDLVKRIEGRLQDDFSGDLLRTAIAALDRETVATRAQHFSVSTRDLSDHMLKQLAPDHDAIKSCTWYEPPSRKAQLAGNAPTMQAAVV